MSSELRDSNVAEMHLGDADFQDESALTPSGDAIFPEARESRPLDVILRRPCPAEVGNKKMVWLGFRIAPSEWPGYLRIGFATDLDFNIATLDIHHTQFDALKTGIDRGLKGLSAGIQLSVPAELMSRQFRRQSGALLFEVREGVSDINVLDLNRNPLMKARLPTPDLMITLRKIPEMLPQVLPAPDRRTLRTARGQGPDLVESLPMAMQEQLQTELQLSLPEHWSRPIDKPEVLDLVSMIRRDDHRYNDVIVNCSSVHLRNGNGLHELHRLLFDFTQSPLVSVEFTASGSSRQRTECRPFFKADLGLMRKTFNADFWTLKAGGNLHVDIPAESRAEIIEKISDALEKVQERWVGKRSIYDRAQFNFWNDELSQDMFFQEQDRQRDVARLKSKGLPIPEDMLQPLFPKKGTIDQLTKMALENPVGYSQFMQERERAARMMGLETVPPDSWIPVSSKSVKASKETPRDPESAPELGALFGPR